MSIFDPNEKFEFLATQTLHYDRYSGRQYFLERVDVNGKYGLVCGEQSDEGGIQTKVLLLAVYDSIDIVKLSSSKAIYNKYLVIANGEKLAQFTFVLNAWVPILCFNPDNARHPMIHDRARLMDQQRYPSQRGYEQQG